MAINNKKQSSGIAEAFNGTFLFGKCMEDDLMYCKNENKKKEDKFIKEKIKLEEERKKQEIMKKTIEMEDKEFLDDEARRLRAKTKQGMALYRPPNAKARGRGSLLEGAVKNEGCGRGRGRSSLPLPLYDRQEKVQRNINQFADHSLHNNQVQKCYWTSQGSDHEEEYDCVTQANFNPYPPDSSSLSDQFEDAFDSPQSNSPQSFCSVPSQTSDSPLSQLEPASASTDPPQQPQICLEVTPSPPRPRKPRGSRLAARFSNLENEENGPEGKQTPEIKERRGDNGDTFTTSALSLAPLALSGFWRSSRSTGISFNDLNPSQRVLSNGILRPEELHRDFTYNVEDFPAL